MEIKCFDITNKGLLPQAHNNKLIGPSRDLEERTAALVDEAASSPVSQGRGQFRICSEKTFRMPSMGKTSK